MDGFDQWGILRLFDLLQGLFRVCCRWDLVLAGLPGTQAQCAAKTQRLFMMVARVLVQSNCSCMIFVDLRMFCRTCESGQAGRIL